MVIGSCRKPARLFCLYKLGHFFIVDHTLEESVSAVTANIHFCEGILVSTKMVKCYPQVLDYCRV